MPDAKIVEFGSKFPAVGQVLPDGVGTLIAPKWVLTTSYVATLIPKGAGIARFEGKEYPVARVFTHIHTTLGPDQAPEIDIALLQLREDVKGLTPVGMYREKDEEGKQVAIVGFGEVGDGKSKTRRPGDDKRRAVTNIITEVTPFRFLCQFNEPPAGTELEGVSAYGDAGAPALIQRDGAWLVAGIHSPYMQALPGQYGVMDSYTRVSTFVQWIEKTMADNR